MFYTCLGANDLDGIHSRSRCGGEVFRGVISQNHLMGTCPDSIDLESRPRDGKVLKVGYGVSIKEDFKPLGIVSVGAPSDKFNSD